MIKFLSRLLLCCVLAGCSKRERSSADDSEWADIQPLSEIIASADSPLEAAVATPTSGNANRSVRTAPQENYAPLIARLAEMKQIERSAGEAMITSESLTFDYERRFVRMDQNVKVVDDRGELETETLMGRFSVDNKVEIIEVSKGVKISSAGREAFSENGTYTFATGSIELAGNAQLIEGVNRLSGDRIQFWVNGNRRMVCEPNAMLEISSASALKEGADSGDGEQMEIRSDRLVYDEEKALAEFDGHVHIRDARASLDAKKVRLYLKENNEIDWIEARSEVIIQTEDRKALADRASYYTEDGRFVLDGDPKVKEGRNIMTGDRITFWQESGRVVCEPNARVLFHPDEEIRTKFLKDLKE